MSTTKYVSAAIEAEGIFARIGANGLPDNSGFAGLVMAGLSRASVKTHGDPLLNARDGQVRPRAAALPPEMATVEVAGTRFSYRRGEGQLVFEDVRCLGAPVASDPILTYSQHPLAILLDSFLASASPLSTSDVPAAGVGSNSFTATDVNAYVLGGLFGLLIDGRVEYSATTWINGTTIHHSPETSTPITGSHTVRPMRTYYPDAALLTGSTFTLRLDGVAWRSWCYGCRVKGVELKPNNGLLQATFTVDMPLIVDDHFAGSPEAKAHPSGAAQHFLGSYFVASSNEVPSDGTATPYALWRTALDVDDLSISLKGELERSGHSQTIAGVRTEITDIECEVSATLSTVVGTFDDDLRDGKRRSILVGFGPGGAAGDGLAMYLPAAVLQTDPLKRDTDGNRVRQMLTWKAGEWWGDDGSTWAGQSSFRLGLGM